MAGENPTVSLEELLAHADWIRRLARALVGSPTDAADLAQDTLEVALSRRPRRAGPLRPWLGGILRNLARKRARGAARRTRREEVAAELAASEPPLPEALVERAQAQQLVAREVLELDEPFRSMLLLRYYEGLPSAQIAERLAIPAGTVRWRLKRALELVRARLDEAHSGERRRWAVLLAPLSGAEEAAGPAGAGLELVKGVLVMKNLKLAAGAAVLVIAALLGGRFILSGSGDSQAPTADSERSAERRVGTTGVWSAQPRRDRGLTAIQEDDPVGSLRLEGQVIDEHEDPVPGARVAIDTRPPRVVETEGDGSFHFEGLIGRHYRLEASSGGGYAGPVQLQLRPDTEPVILRMRAATTVGIRVRNPGGAPVAGARVELRSTLTWAGETGDDGLAVLEGIGAGWHVLRVEAKGFAPHAESFPIRGASSRRDHAVTLARGVRVEGLVADEMGEPIAGARVLAVNVSEPFPVTDLRRDAVITDDEGVFALPALAPGTYRFVAGHPDHAQGTTAPAHIDGQHTRFVRIALAPAGVIEGVVSDSRGEPVAAAHVRAVAVGGIWWRYAREAFTAEDGSFRLTGLPRRALDVVASHVSGSSPLVRANLAERATARVALSLEVTGVVAGLVVDEHGEPVPEAQVTAEPQWTGEMNESQAWDVRGGPPMAITDFRGRFRFVGLPPGNYRVRATRPGAPLPATWAARGVPARTGDEDVRVVLPPESLVRGRVLFADGSAPALYSVAVGGLPPAPFSGDDGSFEVRAPGGERDLVVSGLSFERKVVADVEIDGETDVGTITVERGRSVSGLVLAPNGSPVAGARVVGGRLIAGGGSELNIPGEGFLVKETRTDAEGRYLLTGFGAHPVTLVAQAEDVGRSLSVTIPRGPASAEVDLRLEPVGSLEGRIIVDGEPQAETVVILNPLGVSASNFFVLTGPDGRFAFDVLAPGEYVGYPILGRGGNKAKDMFVQRVTVRAGERARLDIVATYGDIELEVKLGTVSGEPVPVASAVFLGLPDAQLQSMESLRDLSFLLFRRPEDTLVRFSTRMSLDGQPMTFAKLSPGRFTVCVTPLPVEPGDSAALRRLREKGTEHLPMTCAPVTIAAEPTEQSAEILVPDPKEK